MFIASASKGGYKTDVNQQWDAGQDYAFNRQIRNYQNALAADQATYNFNQQNVRDTAANYGTQLKMNQAARQEARDFYKGSTEIDNEMTNWQVGQVRNAHERDQAQALGEAEAQTRVNNTANKASDSAYKFGQSQYQNENLDVEAQAKRTGFEQQTANNQHRMNSTLPTEALENDLKRATANDALYWRSLQEGGEFQGQDKEEYDRAFKEAYDYHKERGLSEEEATREAKTNSRNALMEEIQKRQRAVAEQYSFVSTQNKTAKAKQQAEAPKAKQVLPKESKVLPGDFAKNTELYRALGNNYYTDGSKVYKVVGGDVREADIQFVDGKKMTPQELIKHVWEEDISAPKQDTTKDETWSSD